MLKIKNFRLINVNRVIIGNLNIISLTNKFDQLKEIVLVITETKLDIFPNVQFWFLDFLNHFALIVVGKGAELRSTFVKIFQVSC